jgi:hypothetical protein
MSDLNQETKVPSIPSLDNIQDVNVRNVLAAMKELLEVREGLRPKGDDLDANVTFRDLYKVGLTSVNVGGQAVVNQYVDTSLVIPVATGGGGDTIVNNTTIVTGGDAPDLTIPSIPSGLVATGTAMNVIVEWTHISDANHAHVEVWRSDTNNIGFAVKIGTSDGDIYSDAIGISNATRYYWIRSISKAGIAGGYNAGATGGTEAATLGIGSGDLISVDGAKIVDATIYSAKIYKIDASKIETGTLSADTKITVGGDTPIEIDGATGTITSYSEWAGGTRNYSKLDGGNLYLYRFIPGVGDVAYNYLTRIESGTSNNGETVTIPGYFELQPKVIVSPYNLQVFNSTYNSQSQTLICSAINIRETSFGSKVWMFDASASLNLSSNSGSSSPGHTSGAISTNTWSSNAIGSSTTPANCTSLIVNVSGNSFRGNGASQYNNRSITWIVRYRVSGSVGAFSSSSPRTFAIGASTTAIISDSVTLALAANAYEFYVDYTAQDAGGLFGSITYETAIDTTATNATVYELFLTDGGTLSGLVSSPLTYSLPSGWSITGITFQFDLLANNYGTLPLQGYVAVQHSGIDYSMTPAWNREDGNVWKIGKTSVVASSAWVGSFSIYGWLPSGSGDVLNIRIRNTNATVSRRRPTPNSTTPSNTFNMNSYSYALTAGSLLTPGSLSWVAVGM